MLDYHVVLDMLPTIASLYFEKRLGQEIKLSAVQSSVLLAVGLQRKTVEEVEVRDYMIQEGQTRKPIMLSERAAASCVPGTGTIRQINPQNH